MEPRLTQRGYHLSEVVSALQKEIRRGREREAMFWALELAPDHEHYLWRRLLVIVNEDIGLANINAVRMVGEFRRQYFEFRAYGRGQWLPLANCILMMCRSPKARLADEFLACVLHQRSTGIKPEIPDYALHGFDLSDIPEPEDLQPPSVSAHPRKDEAANDATGDRQK